MESNVLNSKISNLTTERKRKTSACKVGPAQPTPRKVASRTPLTRSYKNAKEKQERNLKKYIKNIRQNLFRLRVF